jgi:hypothetical protein
MSPTAVGNRTLPCGPPRNPLRVMFRAAGACEQPVRSGAHGFRPPRLRSLLSPRKFCRVSRPEKLSLVFLTVTFAALFERFSAFSDKEINHTQGRDRIGPPPAKQHVRSQS